jgi:hypothetical protein
VRCGGDTSGPRRRGGRAEKCTAGAGLTMTAPARAIRAAVHNHWDNEVIPTGRDETAPPRKQTPVVHFSSNVNAIGRIAPRSPICRRRGNRSADTFASDSQAHRRGKERALRLSNCHSGEAAQSLPSRSGEAAQSLPSRSGEAAKAGVKRA